MLSSRSASLTRRAIGFAVARATPRGHSLQLRREHLENLDRAVRVFSRIELRRERDLPDLHLRAAELRGVEQHAQLGGARTDVAGPVFDGLAQRLKPERESES